MNLCRHCGRAEASRPRGLCCGCYYRPQVRAQYPSLSKFGRRSGWARGQSSGLAACPTGALPGSPEKIAVMQQRAALRQELFHPDDATVYGRVELARVG